MTASRTGVRPARPVVHSALAACAFVLCGGAAHAQSTGPFDDLLQKLRAKGVLSQDEYDALKTARDEEIQEQRAERRRQALRAAQEVEKDEKAAEGAKSTVTGKFNNGFTWETPDKKNSITLSGRAQLDYRAFGPEGATGSPAQTGNTTTSGFDIRRAYLGVQGRVWEYYTFDVTADFASSSGTNLSGSQSNSHLDVAWINYGKFKWLEGRIGQFKMPFSLEELTSSRFIDFQERALANSLVPGKERGLMGHGIPYRGIFYGLAISNGAGKNQNDTNTVVEDKDVIGRVAVNAAEWLNNKNMVMHAGVGYTTGTIPGGQSPVGSGVRTEARGIAFFNTANMGTTTTSVDRTRSGGELALAYGPVKLQGEYINANFDWNVGATQFDNDISSYYAEALWLLTGEKYADSYRNGAFGTIRPKSPLGAGGWGAWELALRYSEFDAGDFTPSAGLTNQATAYTLGLKWIPVTNVRFYVNYVRTDFDTRVNMPGGGTTDVEDAITFRAGLYF